MTRPTEPAEMFSGPDLLPMLFPEDLLDDPGDDEQSDGTARWYILQTRPRAERTLARRLFRARIAYFLPTFQPQQQARGRSTCSRLPLFPERLFLKGDDQARSAALRTNLVIRSLEVPEEADLIADLRRIRRLIESGAPLSPHERGRPAKTVRITSGPLAGLRGRLSTGDVSDDRLILFIEVPVLQHRIGIEVPAQQVRAV